MVVEFTGREFSMDAPFEMARETVQQELAFNRAAHFGPQDNRLLDCFLHEELSF